MIQTKTYSKHNTAAIKALFEPKSVAVVGASRRKEAVGYAVLHNLIEGGYKGRIYPLNPKAETIKELRCYPSLSDIVDPVDIAILVIPSKDIPATLELCGKKQVKAAIVISAGFREVGPEEIG